MTGVPEPDRRPDVLGEPYLVETIDLAPDDEGAVEANLVLHPAAPDRVSSGGGRRAVLHVHGFADYFFHTEYAGWWAARGWDFHALDLRKYGRSLRPHHTPNHVDSLTTYYEELDAAWARIVERDGHTEVVLSAHSTGGLTAALWAHDRGLADAGLVGLVLNSPWLDLQGSPLLRNPVTTAALRRLGARRPRRALRRAITTVYGESLHHEHRGEWVYDLAWKPLDSWPIHLGWLAAVRTGHARVHRGLDVRAPVLVLTSGASARPTGPDDPAVDEHDIVLEVEQIRRWAPRLGPHVTLVSVPGARHDVVLSRPGPRARVYDELARWTGAYLA